VGFKYKKVISVVNPIFVSVTIPLPVFANLVIILFGCEPGERLLPLHESRQSACSQTQCLEEDEGIYGGSLIQ